MLHKAHHPLPLTGSSSTEPQLPIAQGAKLSMLAVRCKDKSGTTFEVPPELPQGPCREALNLANKATFTQLQLEASQKVKDEGSQVRELAAAKWAEGRAEGLAEGHQSGLVDGKRSALLRLPARAGLELTAEEKNRGATVAPPGCCSYTRA